MLHASRLACSPMQLDPEIIAKVTLSTVTKLARGGAVGAGINSRIVNAIEAITARSPISMNPLRILVVTLSLPFWAVSCDEQA